MLWRILVKKLLLALSLVAICGAAPLVSAAEDTSQLNLENQLFNDFAGRLQEHLHKTAALLEKIRESKDLKERQKFMKEYTQAMQTTAKVTAVMQDLGGEQPAGMMAGQKMKGMSCPMMRQRASASQTGSAVGTDSDQAEEDAGKPESAGHEGHH
jgi:predicted RND superfamily exporter protein